MPVVAFANPKGGTGKSTTALVLGTTLAQKGYNVSVIDADPRQVVAHWKYDGRSRNPVHVVRDVTERTILKTVEDRSKVDDVVLIDLEGTASLLMSRAISRSDLVLIPMQAAALDARGATEVLELIQQEEHSFRRKIDARVVFTRTTTAIVTKIEKKIRSELDKNEKPYLRTKLAQRQAYNAMFAGLRDLYELDPGIVAGLAKARENAEELADELLTILESKQNEAAS